MSRMTHRRPTRSGRAARHLVAAAALACGEAAPPPQKTDTPVAAAPASAAPDSSLATLAPLRAVHFDDQLADSLFGARADSSDLGTGVLALRVGAGTDSSRYPWADTLRLRAAPRGDAAVVAAWIVAMPSSGSWEYALHGPGGARPNDIEYEYEERGLPIDSTSGTWVRAIVGWDTAGARVTGWADATDTARVRLVAWAEKIKEAPWFFRDSTQARLFTSLDDTLSEGDRPPGEFTMDPLESRGRWLRVRFRAGVEPCDEQDTTGKPTRDVWIPYLDRRGRPLVFYPTRGC